MPVARDGERARPLPLLALVAFTTLTIPNEVKTKSLGDKHLLGSGGRWLSIGTILLGNAFPVALKALATQVVCSRIIQKLQVFSGCPSVARS